MKTKLAFITMLGLAFSALSQPIQRNSVTIVPMGQPFTGSTWSNTVFAGLNNFRGPTQLTNPVNTVIGSNMTANTFTVTRNSYFGDGIHAYKGIYSVPTNSSIPFYAWSGMGTSLYSYVIADPDNDGGYVFTVDTNGVVNATGYLLNGSPFSGGGGAGVSTNGMWRGVITNSAEAQIPFLTNAAGFVEFLQLYTNTTDRVFAFNVTNGTGNSVSSGYAHAGNLISLTTNVPNFTFWRSSNPLNIANTNSASTTMTNPAAAWWATAVTNAGGPTLIASDDFNRSDSSSLGANYTELIVGGNSHAMEIFTDVGFVGHARGQISVLTADMWSGAGSFNANQSSKVQVKNLSSGLRYIQAYVRMSGTVGSLNGYAASTDGASGSTHTEILKFTAGAQSTLKIVTATFADDDIFECQASGTTISLWKNGVQIDSITDSSFSSGNPGLGAYGQGVAETWQGWNL
jgi:hypothetical protein